MTSEQLHAEDGSCCADRLLDLDDPLTVDRLAAALYNAQIGSRGYGDPDELSRRDAERLLVGLRGDE